MNDKEELKGYCCLGCYESVIINGEMLTEQEACYKSGHYHDCGHLAQELASKKHPFLEPAMNEVMKCQKK